MNKRTLGNSGIEVSEIAFGGVEIGMPYGVGIKSSADMLSKSGAIKLLHKAVNSGINFFDTARMYGKSEQIMGEAFNDRRSKVIIATKCVHLLDKDGNLPLDSELKMVIEKSLHESLKALRTDYLDIFMLHQANQEILKNETIAEVFSEFKKKGFVRATGISTYALEDTKTAVNSGRWDVIQLPFNLMDQRQRELFEKAQEKGVGIVVRSVLLKGLLSNRGKNLHPALKNVENHIVKYEQLLEKTGYTLPILATKFALSYPEVSSVLVGIDKEEYLEEALRTVDGNCFNNRDLEKIKQLAYPDPEFIDLPYWDKMNWLR